MPKKSYATAQPMRIQARKGSAAEKKYYVNSALPSGVWPMPKAIAPGILPSVLDDLIYHGGKVVSQMEFQNIFLGSSADWKQSDISNIDSAITRAMQEPLLNNVMVQYFPGAKMSCDSRPLLLLNDPKPVRMGEPEVQGKVIA